jgi:hypothetical protein
VCGDEDTVVADRSAMAFGPYPFARITPICECFRMASVVLGRCLPSSLLGGDNVLPTTDQQLTLDLLVVTVISQTRSEYGGQDKESVSIV